MHTWGHSVTDLIIEKGMSHLDVGVMLSDDSPFEAYSLFFTKKPDRGDIPRLLMTVSSIG